LSLTLVSGLAASANTPEKEDADLSSEEPSPITIFDNSELSPPPTTLFESDDLIISTPPDAPYNGVEEVENLSEVQEEDEIKVGSIEVPPLPELDPKPKVYKENLFSNKGDLFQYDNTTCVPATTQMILNFIYQNGSGGEGFDWELNTSNQKQRKLRSWIRAHDTLYPGGVGSDPNGWRNGLNKFGWNEFKKQNKRVYEVMTFNNKDNAMRTIVESIAKYDKPVGVIGWNGKHAYIVHGYVADGDPAESDDYKVKSIFMTSPLRSDHIVNKKISYRNFKKGKYNERLTRYHEDDSPFKDKYSSGNKRADKDWSNSIILLIPVK